MIGAWLARSVLMQSPIGALIYAVGRGLKGFFGVLDGQGWIGLAASLFLALKLIHSVGEERHWKKQSAGFETLYRREHAAFGQTVLNYRAAAEQARQADAANKIRVQAEQAAINERTSNEFEARLAAARATADRLRAAAAAAHSGSGGAAPVPGVPAAAGGSAQGAVQDRLSLDDALTATEQALQLDELIKWIRRQHAVDVNSGGPPRQPAPLVLARKP